MNLYDDLKPGGSGILPEETPPKFFARHFSSYHFALPYIKDRCVLEIGFGDGYGADFLAQYAREVKAIDVLEKNIILASNKYKRQNLEFREMDAVNLNFPDGMFDVIVSFQVIEHIPENSILEYLKGIKRVLKKDGTSFISTLNLEKNRKPNKEYAKNPFHIKEFTYKEFDSTIKDVFESFEVYGLFYTKRLMFYERLKKVGIFRFLPSQLDVVDRFYRNITVNDFVWRKENLGQCIDFMAMCKKGQTA